MKLVEDTEGLVNRDLPLLGMSKENDWALHGPFLDKTLIRNYMWMNISAEIMGYAPEVRFCEVILNGEYQGVYVLMETIKEDDYRVNLSDYEEGSDQTSYLVLLDDPDGNRILNNYTQYTYEMEFSTKEDDPEQVTSSTGIQVLYPQEEYQSQGVLDYIQQLQREGTVRHIGMSSHTPQVVNRVLDMGILDLLMFSINPGYDYHHGDYAIGGAEERMALYRRCEAEGVGISVMKAFSGGQLLNAKTSPFGQALTEYQCLQYALDKPGVLTVLPGVRNRADLTRILGFLDASPEERDYSVLGTVRPPGRLRHPASTATTASPVRPVWISD